MSKSDRSILPRHPLKWAFNETATLMCLSLTGGSGFLSVASSIAVWDNPTPLRVVTTAASAVATAVCAYGAYRFGRKTLNSFKY